jgi:hypothetical protein
VNTARWAWETRVATPSVSKTTFKDVPGDRSQVWHREGCLVVQCDVQNVIPIFK